MTNEKKALHLQNCWFRVQVHVPYQINSVESIKVSTEIFCVSMLSMEVTYSDCQIENILWIADNIV
jgi:hypothetical protein